ncbi:UNVERIFIED_CONTAM: hypothetical protein PYX00_003009 [Menopon gallinae]|uniref:Branchpoint-bridging protein n=1 Tax=Menopon gallinae TaxID=328185 RepID=A0AAW2HZ73_9NEOP
MSLLNPSYLQAGRLQQEISKVQEKLKRENQDREEKHGGKRKKSRWGAPDADKTFIPGMPTVLPTNLTKEQEEGYLLQLQIEEVSRKLRSGDLGIPPNPEDRSPSPEPIYSHDGKRLNTREYRTRKALEEERHSLILRMQAINPDFKPPADYKPPLVRVSDKVMIPQEDHPDINFVGLLIGPRGNTLKTMEKDTGAKIIIRGKGSVKEGKVGRKDGQPLPGEDEPLHAYVTANNPEAVKKAVERIKEVIRQGVEVPEGQNDLRRNQLRELALLNGTLREVDGPRCSNCGATDHKQWMCPDKPNVTKSIVCSSCGGSGHIARDCRSKRPGASVPNTASESRKIDQEYMSLMAELGEGPPPDRDMDKNRNDRDNRTDARFNRAASNNLFDRQQGPIKALMAPENSIPTPPSLIQNNMPPPAWPPNASTHPGQANMAAPPPGVPTMAQPPMWPPTAQTAQPPPPPQPLLPWLSNATLQQQPPPPGGSLPNQPPPNTAPPLPPWQQPPPVPPPQMYPPWQAPGYNPQPVQPPPQPNSILAGLHNLIAAPPPPPPS